MDILEQLIADTARRYQAHEQARDDRLNHLRRLQAKQKGGDWRRVDDPARILRRLTALGLEEAAARAMSATETDDGVPVFNPLERILGEKELQSSSFLITGAAVARAVGRIVIRSVSGAASGYGTGFLVSPRLLLTNNHVLKLARSAARSVVQFDYRETLDGEPIAPVEYGLDPDTFFVTDRALDFTLVAVTGDPAAHQARGSLRLIADSGKAIVGERVNIIQHPGGERQQVALRANEIVDLLEDHLHYKTDTQPGSSGSPVLNDNWELAALHHSGVPKRDASGRILTRSGAPWDGRRDTVPNIAWEANEGVRISRIVAHVRARNLSAAQRALFERAFEGPRSAPIEGAPPPPETSPPPSADAQPTLGPDGTAIWTLPIEIRVAIPTSGPGPSGAPGPPAPTGPSTPVAGPPRPNSSEDRRLLDRIRSFEDETYYDPTQDQSDQTAYYAGIDPDAPANELAEALGRRLKSSHTTEVKYRSARLDYLYPWVDLREDRTLRSIYSGRGFSPEEIVRLELEIEAARELERAELLRREGALTDERLAEIDDLLESSSPYNCEHVVPQSWFGKKEPMRGDLHHLFTCESRCNSFRSNVPYDQFSPEDEVVREDCGRREPGRFEPSAGRGTVARATLYFVLRYPGLVGDENRELQRERIPVLLAWHDEEPPDLYERHRNAAIFGIQGNRNPLIDHPDWATRIGFESRLG